MAVLRGSVLVASVLVLVLATACKPSSPRPRGHWVATAPGAGDLATAQRQCTTEATKASEGLRQEQTASSVAITSFLHCMEARGWKLERTDDAGATPAP